VRLLAQAKTEKAEPVMIASFSSQRARGIIDLSVTKLMDRPSFLEEKLLKTRGVISAEINVYSNRMVVEFDPSLISLEKIKTMIKATSTS
jgi:heavy-metal-associated domain-containing protein